MAPLHPAHEQKLENTFLAKLVVRDTFPRINQLEYCLVCPYQLPVSISTQYKLLYAFEADWLSPNLQMSRETAHDPQPAQCFTCSTAYSRQHMSLIS